jgi:pimeloyl-ACP methyl ester carboxylesterase
MHDIFLIPGFFGFANFGDIKYFSHVREVLMSAANRHGHEVRIHYVKTLPTASLERRAAAVADAIVNSAAEGSSVHLVGHSTGGLDARLLTSPGVTLPSEHDVEALAKRVSSVVSVAAPHSGTPLASFFVDVVGQQFLWAFSTLTMHGLRLGSMPLPAMLALAGSLPSMGKQRGPLLGLLEQVYRQLLQDFDEPRRLELEEFLRAAQSDQSLLPQLAPQGAREVLAETSTRPTTRYGAVVTQARPPSLRSTVDVGLSPTGQAMYALYRGLHQLAGSMEAEDFEPLSEATRQKLIAAYGTLPTSRSNDSIVPTLSQAWGEVIHATWADHLDVIGHFSGPDLTPRHYDWLSTQTHFTIQKFESLWNDIADFVFADFVFAAE